MKLPPWPFGVAFLATLLLGACSSDDGPTGPLLVAGPWSGEIQVLDAAGSGIPGLLVQIQYATEDLPKKTGDVGDIASAELDAFTDHDGIARPQTGDLSQLWIHQLRVSTAAATILHEEVRERTNEPGLGELDPTQHLFVLDVSVDYEIPAARDSIAVQSIIGTWRTAFSDAGINYGRALTYYANGRFTGVLTQSGNEFRIAGTWLVRNLILTTAFDFNGIRERHSTRFEVSGTSMTTTGIPAGTPRQWEKQ